MFSIIGAYCDPEMNIWTSLWFSGQVRQGSWSVVTILQSHFNVKSGQVVHNNSLVSVYTYKLANVNVVADKMANESAGGVQV